MKLSGLAVKLANDKTLKSPSVVLYLGPYQNAVISILLK